MELKLRKQNGKTKKKKPQMILWVVVSEALGAITINEYASIQKPQKLPGITELKTNICHKETILLVEAMSSGQTRRKQVIGGSLA